MYLGELEERIVFSVVMNFSTEQETHAASDLLRASVGITSSKNGCLECQLEISERDPLKLDYREQWETEERFRKHVGSLEFKHVLTAIDMCCETPEVKIGKLRTSSGVESLREIYFEGVGIPGERPEVKDQGSSQSEGGMKP